MRRAVLAVAAAVWCLPAHAQTGCFQQTESQLLNQFSDNAAAGSITPQVMRNFVCSVMPFPLPVYTVSLLPACTSANQYTWAAVTDANSPTYNGALTGGSSTVVPVFCNGTAWKSH